MKIANKLCIGNNEGSVKIFDLTKFKSSIHSHESQVFSNLHSGRIGSLCCSPHTNLIVTGSKDGYITLQDPRSS